MVWQSTAFTRGGSLVQSQSAHNHHRPRQAEICLPRFFIFGTLDGCKNHAKPKLNLAQNPLERQKARVNPRHWRLEIRQYRLQTGEGILAFGESVLKILVHMKFDRSIEEQACCLSTIRQHPIRNTIWICSFRTSELLRKPSIN